MPTLDTPGQVAAAIPVMLGFQPENSAVIIVTVDDAIGLTMRVDLPQPFDDADTSYAEQWLAPVTSTITRTFDSPEAFVAFYPAGPVLDSPAVMQLLTTLEGIGTHVRAAITVTGERWHCASCETGATGTGSAGAAAVAACAAGTCSPEGAEITAADRAHVRALFGEHPVAASRQALAEEVAPAHADARARIATRIGELPLVGEDTRDEYIQAFHGALSAPELDDAVAARLLCGLADTRVRDTVVWDIVHSSAPVQQRSRALLRTLTRLAPDSHLAPPATLLAVCTWLTGDGARALLALDRAAEGDPHYSLGDLVSRMVSSGMHPRVWVEGMQSLTREACRGGLVSAGAPAR